jgi:hypothetical protein
MWKSEVDDDNVGALFSPLPALSECPLRGIVHRTVGCGGPSTIVKIHELCCTAQYGVLLAVASLSRERLLFL